MILLLNCLKSWCQNNHHIPSIGERDSVLVSYNDLRKANAKMIELKYEKVKNDSLVNIIKTDTQIINDLELVNKRQEENNKLLEKAIKKQKVQTIIFKTTTVASVIGIVISLLK